MTSKNQWGILIYHSHIVYCCMHIIFLMLNPIYIYCTCKSFTPLKISQRADGLLHRYPLPGRTESSTCWSIVFELPYLTALSVGLGNRHGTYNHMVRPLPSTYIVHRCDRNEGVESNETEKRNLQFLEQLSQQHFMKNI